MPSSVDRILATEFMFINPNEMRILKTRRCGEVRKKLCDTQFGCECDGLFLSIISPENCVRIGANLVLINFSQWLPILMIIYLALEKPFANYFFLVQILRPTPSLVPLRRNEHSARVKYYSSWFINSISRWFNSNEGTGALLQMPNEHIACVHENKSVNAMLCAAPLPSYTHNEQTDRTRENRWKIGHRLRDAFGCSLHVWCTATRIRLFDYDRVPT